VDAGVVTWGGLIAFIVLAFIVDFFFFQRDHHTPPTLKRAAVWSVIWIAVAILFGVGLLLFESTQAGSEYLTGYLLERSLSLDNVFVFALIFSAMAVPISERQNVLELGIIFALILRAIFIVAGATLVESFSWVLYIFGAILLYTGIQMARHRGEEEDVDPEKNIGVRALKKVIPVTEDFRGSAYFVKENGKRMATPLLAVVAAVATADVIFAVDSIPPSSASRRTRSSSSPPTPSPCSACARCSRCSRAPATASSTSRSAWPSSWSSSGSRC
jgi:tellurite resistance protein TerC